MVDLTVEFELDALKESYRDSENPLFAWVAFKVCCETGHPIPGWVLDYLEDVATELLLLSEKTKIASGRPYGRAANEVYKALGMSKPGSKDVFERFDYYSRDHEIFRRICGRIVKDSPNGIVKDETVDHAVYEVSKEKLDGFAQKFVSAKTIRRIYYRWRKRFIE